MWKQGSTAYTDMIILSDDDVGSSNLMALSEKQMILNEIESLVGQYGKQMRRGVYQMIDMFVKKPKILPLALVKFADILYLVRDLKRSLPSCADLAHVLAFVPCVLVEKMEDGTFRTDSIVNCDVPLQQTVNDITYDMCDKLGVVAENGALGVGTSKVDYVIDYIVPKFDGVPIFAIRLYTNVSEVTLISYTNKFAFIKGVKAFAGEMLDEEICVFYGSSFQTDFPLTLMLESVNYKLIPTSLVTMTNFLLAKGPKERDGYVFSINGLEYRIKDNICVDLLYKSGASSAFTSEGYAIEVIPSDSDGIVEFKVCSDGLLANRIRNDKLKALDHSTVKRLLATPNATYLRQVLASYGCAQLGLYRNVYPVSALISMVVSDLKKANSHIVHVTSYSVRMLLMRRKVFANDAQISAVIVALSTERKEVLKLTKDDLNKISVSKVVYADCPIIYDAIYKMGIMLPLYETAKYIAEKRNVVVGIRRIALMVSRGELLCIGQCISVKIIAGIKHENYEPRKYDRVMCVEDSYDVIRGLVAYAKNNNGKFVADAEMNSFIAECNELLDSNLDKEQLQEVGDVIMMWTKVLLRLYTDGTLIFDPDAVFWQLLYRNKVMEPFFEKVERRLSKYNCVRNHVTSSDHVCSSGKEFLINPVITAYKEDKFGNDGLLGSHGNSSDIFELLAQFKEDPDLDVANLGKKTRKQYKKKRK